MNDLQLALKALSDQVWIIDINVYHFENHYFRLWFLYKTELRISTVGKRIGMIRYKYFKP